MLRYKVHQFKLRGTHYLLLPKLNSKQMGLLSERFKGDRILTASPNSVVVRTKEGKLNIDSAGLCWSAFDPSDEILPTIPGILDCEKEAATLRTMESLYFRRSTGATEVRFMKRLESSSNWDALLSAGDCALSPDERTACTFLLGQAGGRYELLTDFPEDGSTPKICGRRRFFVSTIDGPTVSTTLRVAGKRNPRNSYLPRDGVLHFVSGVEVNRQDLVDLFDRLGEWCSFTIKAARKL